jgi:integrase
VLADGTRPRIWAPTKEALYDEVDRRDKDARGISHEEAPADYDELCDRLLAVYTRRESSKAALRSDLNASRRKFGKRPPQLITRYEIQQWMKDLATEPSPYTGKILSRYTQDNYVEAMDRALQFGVDNEWLGKNRAAGLSVEVGDADPQPFDSWQQMFEVARTFEHVGWPVGSKITRFAGGLGLRIQEVLVARDCDLDRTAGTFHVQRTWDDTLRREVEMTKNDASSAVVNLTTIAAQVADEIPPAIHRDPDQWSMSPLLFAHEDGSPISPDYFLRKWQQVMKLLLPHIKYRPPKHLRHTFATLTLLELGVEKIKIVADLLRHESYRTTEQHYIKKVQEMRRRSAAAASQGMPAYSADPRRENADATACASVRSSS